MSEFLVDRITNEVRSTHTFPLKFSISGKFIVNCPNELLVEAKTNLLSELLTKKIDGFKKLHPDLVNTINDEFITSPNVDQAQSSKISIGIGKRTSIFPTGSLVTNTFVVAITATKVFSHWHSFLLASNPSLSSLPGPDDLLYGYNIVTQAFEEFEPSAFTVEIRNSTNTATIATLISDTEQSIALTPGNYRLRFINNDLSKVYFLSDWVLLRN